MSLIADQVAALRWILGHPLNKGRPARSVARWAAFQVRSRLLGPFDVPFIEGTRLFVGPGLSSANMQHYAGAADLDVIGFLMHGLREGDLFVDVGANLGVMSVVAAGVAGSSAMALEPHPSTYTWLLRNVELNGIGGRVQCIQSAVGAAKGEVSITSELGAANHVAAGDGGAIGAIRVPCARLDQLLEDRRPAVLKIDVEGFETAVIDGAGKLVDDPALQAIIIEMVGHGARYGCDERELAARIAAHGFEPCTYDIFSRQLAEMPKTGRGPANVIFVRDREHIAQVVRGARKRDLGWREKL